MYRYVHDMTHYRVILLLNLHIHCVQSIQRDTVAQH